MKSNHRDLQFKSPALNMNNHVMPKELSGISITGQRYQMTINAMT